MTWLNHEDVAFASINLAQAYWFRGEREEAWRTLERAKKTIGGQQRVSTAWLEAATALFNILQGNVAAASAWAGSVKLDGQTIPFLQEFDYWVLARVRMTEGKVRKALLLLEKTT